MCLLIPAEFRRFALWVLLMRVFPTDALLHLLIVLLRHL